MRLLSKIFGGTRKEKYPEGSTAKTKSAGAERTSSQSRQQIEVELVTTYRFAEESGFQVYLQLLHQQGKGEIADVLEAGRGLSFSNHSPDGKDDATTTYSITWKNK